MFDTITVTVEGPIGTITLNRPKTLNAINRTMTKEVTEALKALNEDEQVRAIVVTGAGRAFSSGFDLAPVDAPTSTKGWHDFIQADYDFLIQFWNSRKPTIAAVHGYCLAGAFELALACDMTIAAEGTMFGEPEVRFGQGIVCMLLPWVVGAKIAKELLLTGIDKVDANRAYELGIVNRVVPAGTEMAEAQKVARSMAAASPLTVQMMKQAINRTYDTMGLRTGLAAALDACFLLSSVEDADHAEFEAIRRESGLKAALAWRDARFT